MSFWHRWCGMLAVCTLTFFSWHLLCSHGGRWLTVVGWVLVCQQVFGISNATVKSMGLWKLWYIRPTSNNKLSLLLFQTATTTAGWPGRTRWSIWTRINDPPTGQGTRLYHLTEAYTFPVSFEFLFIETVAACRLFAFQENTSGCW